MRNAAETSGALEGEAPQRRPQRRLGRRWEGVAKAVGGGYCRLSMPLRLARAVSETLAGHRLGAPEGGGAYHPPFQCIPGRNSRKGQQMGRKPATPSATTATGPRHSLQCLWGSVALAALRIDLLLLCLSGISEGSN